MNRFSRKCSSGDISQTYGLTACYDDSFAFCRQLVLAGKNTAKDIGQHSFNIDAHASNGILCARTEEDIL
jgi:hypothetical protein